MIGTVLDESKGRVGRQLARRRRRERLAGTLLTALGIAVLVLAVVALRHPQGHGSSAGTVTVTHSVPPSTVTATATSAAPTSAAPTTSAATTSAAAGHLPLVVLNDTTVAGLAQQAAATFQAGGWTVTRYGNYSNNILSTCAYYDPATPGAQAAAARLRAQFPAIKRSVPKFAGLPAGPIVVVLTPDYLGH